MSKSNKKKNQKSSKVGQVTKQEDTQNKEVSIVTTEESATNEVVVEESVEQDTKKEKTSKDNKAKNKKQKDKDGFAKKTGNKVASIISELKKVSWPSFKQACKQTGSVLLIVVIFCVVLLAINSLLGLLFGLITGSN